MVLWVGTCRIDCDRREIVRDGQVTHVPPKAFELLQALIDARPKIVKKEELLAHVWPDTYVSEANLAVLVGDLRTAIGDSAREPRIIKTHHAVGYSFIGDVTQIAAPTRVTAPTLVLRVRGRRIVLPDGRHAVGRGKHCDIVIDDPTVSRVHAWLEVNGTTLTVEDQSKNGTLVNGTPVMGKAIAAEGQRIVFGSVPALVGVDRPIEDSTLTMRDRGR